MSARGGAEVRTLEDFASWARRGAEGLTFAGPDPHHGIGLHALVPGYRIVTIDDAPALDVLRANGVEAYALAAAESPGELSRSSQTLLADPGARAFLDARAVTRLLVFKSSHGIETECRRRGWSLLAAPAVVARRWENKVAFRSLAGELGLPQPAGEIVDLSETPYADVARRLGARLVVQSAHGYGGNRTLAADDAEGWAAAVARLKAGHARVTARVDGLPLTLNACVTARGVAVGAPCVQLTGEPELTPYPLGSCGNDWCAAGSLDLPVAALVALAERVGEALAGDDYRGIFGLDLVLTEDGEPFVIEVNPRLVASIALYTQLEVLAGRLPLLARHVLAFLAPDLDDAPLDAHLGPVAGAQVILHNIAPRPIGVTSRVAAGVYRHESGGGLTLARPAATVDRLASPDEILLLPPAAGRHPAPGTELARLQTRGTVTGPDGCLLPGIAEAVRIVRARLGAFPGPTGG